MSLLPNNVLFWGGPFDGAIKWVDNYRVITPVLQEFFAKYEGHSDYWNDAHLAIEYVEYHAHLFIWEWKGYAREALVMTTSFGEAMQVESVMKFLESLWGR